VNATFVSQSEIVCVAPPVEVNSDTVQLQVSINSLTYTDDDIKFRYHLPLRVSEIWPARGPTQGGSSVHVSVQNLIKVSTNTVLCRFIFRNDQIVKDVSGTFLDENTIVCVTPSTNHPTQASVEVSTNAGRDFTQSSFQFQFEELPTIMSIVPILGYETGGTKLRLLGVDLPYSESLSCRFQDESDHDVFTSAKWISEREIECMTPSHRPGKVSIDVTANGVDYTQHSHLIFEYLDVATVTSIKPSSGTLFGGSKVIVQGKNLVPKETDHTNVRCRFGHVEVDARIIKSSSSLECTSPPLSESKLVTFGVSVNGGVDYVLSHHFEYVPQPRVLSVNPTMGPSRGGTFVQVSGENFVESSTLSCRFGESHIGIRAEFVSSTEIRCRSPPLEFGLMERTVRVQVSSDGNDYGSYPGSNFRYVPGIQVLEIDPSAAATDGGTEITIRGQNFISSNSTRCRFGTSDAVRAIVQSPRLVTCSVPSSTTYAPGIITIAYANNGVDFETSGSIVLRPRVSLTKISESSSPSRGGVVITIRGTNFETESTKCHFDTFPVDAFVIDDTSLACVTPPLRDIVNNNDVTTLPYAVPLSVSNNYRDFSKTVSILYTKTPVLDIFTPSHITMTLSTSNPAVTILGQGFESASTAAEIRCRFESIKSQQFVDSTAVVISDRMIQCDAPSQNLSLGHHDMSLVMWNNLKFPLTSSSFQVLSPPTVSEIHPTIGPWNGGTRLTISGSDFFEHHMYECKIGDTIVSATQINEFGVLCDETVEVSSPRTATVSLRIDNHYLLELKDKFVFAHLPSFVSHDHNMSSVRMLVSSNQDTTLLEEAHNSNQLRCQFGEYDIVEAEFENGEVKCTASHHEENTWVRLSLNGGLNFWDDHRVLLEFMPVPTLRSVVPYRGVASGGNVVTVSGDRFRDMPSLSCRFGTTVVNASYISETSLECVSPAMVQQTDVDLSVSNDGKIYSMNSLLYRTSVGAIVTSLEPSFGSINGGTIVTVRGSHFTESKALTCRFGTLHVSAATYLTSQAVTCVSPQRLELGTVSLHVTNDGDRVVAGGHQFFEFVQPHVVNEMSPRYGSISGNTRVEIRGYGFIETNRLACRFSRSSMSSVVDANYESSTQISCISPAAMSTSNVTVEVTVNGQDYVAVPMLFEYIRRPVVTTMTPVRGPVRGGTTIEFSGVNLFAARASSVRCKFGDNQIRPIKVTDTSVLCITPSSPNATQMATSLVINSEEQQAFVFEYYVSAEISSILPESLSRVESEVITIRGQNFEKHADMRCRFDSNSNVFVSKATWHSDAKITCTSPSSNGEQTSLRISKNGGEDYSKTWFQFHNLAASSLVVTSSSASGPFIGGTVMTLRLQGGASLNLQLSCKFGETIVLAANVHQDDQGDTVLECETPSYPAAENTRQSVNVSILHGSNVLSLTAPISFTYNPVIRVTHVSPDVGKLSGGTVLVLSGHNFFIQDRSTFVCRFGVTTTTNAIVKSDTELECVTPESNQEGVVTISVSANGGSDFSATSVQFYYAETPEIHTVVPNRVSRLGGTTVTVRGAGFVQSQNLSCRFGSIVVPAQFQSSTLLKCDTPSQNAGFARFQVSNNALEFDGTSKQIIEFIVPHTITNVSPSRASSVGGLDILVTGTGFVAGGEGEEGSNVVICRFVREDNTGFTSSRAVVRDERTVSCIVPPQRTSLVYVEVSLNNGAEFSQGLPVEIYEAPTISSVKPKHVFTKSDTFIYLTGSNFIESEELRCRFDDEFEVIASWISESMVMCELTSSIIMTTNQELPRNLRVSVSNFNREYVDYGLGLQVSQPLKLSVVRPLKISELGGTTLLLRSSLQGEGDILHYSAYKCRFRSVRDVVTPAVRRTYETAAFECEIPALEPGTVSVELLGFHDMEEEQTGWLISKTSLEVEAAKTLLKMRLSKTTESNDVDEIVSYKMGGTEILLEVSVDLEDEPDDGLYCVFGDDLVKASKCIGNIVYCTSPALDRTGNVEVKLRVFSESNENKNENAYYDLIGNPQQLMLKYIETPVVREVVPKTIPLSGGVTLTIRGDHFVNTPSLRARVDSIETSNVRFLSKTELLVELREAHPERHAIENFKLVPVVVSVNSVDFSPESVLVSMERDVEIRSIRPSRCPTSGGHNVIVSGGPFALPVRGDKIRCRFGSVMTSLATRLSFTQLECPCPVAPNGIGVLSFAISLDGGHTYTTSTNLKFEYIAPAQIVSLNPSIGPQTGGTRITMLGTNFREEDGLDCVFAAKALNARSGSRHKDSRVRATVFNSTHLACIVPSVPYPRDAGVPHSGIVSVSLSSKDFVGQRNMGNEYAYHQDRNIEFLYHDIVVVTSVSPFRGYFEGGTIVSVIGKHFTDSSTLSCRFGTHGVTQAQFLDSEHLLCSTPPSSSISSSVFVQVSNNGLDFSRGGPRFTFVPKLEILNLIPSVGSVSGGTEIRVIGHGFEFANDLKCKFGTNDVNATRVMRDVVSCISPVWSRAETVRVSISSNGNDFEEESSLQFDYVTLPIVYDISPSKGPSRGGTELTLRGGNFFSVKTVKMLCEFHDDISTPVTVLSDTLAMCVTPNHALGRSEVRLVSDNAVQTQIMSRQRHEFLFYRTEFVTKIYPSFGPSHGGTVITVSGRNFLPGSSCRFGDNNIVPAVSISTTRLRCTSPSIVMNEEAILGLSVSNNGVDFPEERTQFVYYATEIVSSVSPSRGAHIGGTSVTVRGENFQNTTELSCRFGDVVVSPATFQSSEQVECATPSNHASREIQRITIKSDDISSGEIQNVRVPFLRL
jgi:hypothetical protein